METTSTEPPQDPSPPTWRGIPMLQWRNFWFTPESLEGAKEMTTKFKPLPSDIILASFPKTGTTWLKALLFSITNRSSPNYHSLLTAHNPHMLVPHLEFHIYGPHPQDLASFPGSTMSSSNNTRVVATHVPYQIIDGNVYSSDCRVVYITRNPKDTIVSYWQFTNKILNEDEEQMKLEYVVDKFCKGTLIYGPYYDHVIGYWKQSLEKPDKVLFVTYEELQENPFTQVKRLGEFLGRPFETDKEAEEIVQSCSIERLTEHEVNKSGTDMFSPIKMPSHSFFRKGKVRDYMTPDMIERIDTITKQKFYASGLSYGVEASDLE